ncbi:hypothetical protein NK280_23750, partial [Salmonella enterica]|nr:hypothetical protein [Salmonella enterica]
RGRFGLDALDTALKDSEWTALSAFSGAPQRAVQYRSIMGARDLDRSARKNSLTIYLVVDKVGHMDAAPHRRRREAALKSTQQPRESGFFSSQVIYL